MARKISAPTRLVTYLDTNSQNRSFQWDFVAESAPYATIIEAPTDPNWDNWRKYGDMSFSNDFISKITIKSDGGGFIEKYNLFGDNTVGNTIEFKVQFDSASNPTTLKVGFYTGAYYETISLTDNSIALDGLGTSASPDFVSTYRIVRCTIVGDSIYLYVDNELTLSGTLATTTTENKLSIEYQASTASDAIYWYTLRYAKGINFSQAFFSGGSSSTSKMPGLGSELALTGSGATWTFEENLPDTSIANRPMTSIGAAGATAYTKYLYGSKFNFNIPEGAIINGIKATYSVKSSGPSIIDQSVKIVKGGAVVGTDLKKAGNIWTGTYADRVYGSSTELWGVTWASSQINSSDFGIAYSCRNINPGGGVDGYINSLTVEVFYTIPYIAYELQIDTSSDFNSINLQTYNLDHATYANGDLTPVFSIKSLPRQYSEAAVFYWRVRVNNGDYTSDWSDGTAYNVPISYENEIFRATFDAIPDEHAYTKDADSSNVAIIIKAYANELDKVKYAADEAEDVFKLYNLKNADLATVLGVLTSFSKPTGDTDASYRSKLQNVLEAYRIGTSKEALYKVVKAFVGVYPGLKEYISFIFFDSPSNTEPVFKYKSMFIDSSVSPLGTEMYPRAELWSRAHTPHVVEITILNTYALTYSSSTLNILIRRVLPASIYSSIT